MIDNLTADDGRFKLGRQEPLPEHADRGTRLATFVGPDLPEPPAVINYRSKMSRVDMLGNDRYGDCVFASFAHLAQAVTAEMGRERIFTEEETLEGYSLCTGFDRRYPETDRGANLFLALEWWKETGFFGEIEGWARVKLSDWRKSRQAMYLGGPLLAGLDLPLSAQRQRKWRMEMGLGDEQIRPRSWGGHATSVHSSILDRDGVPIDGHITWAADKLEDHTFRDGGYHPEGYVVLFKGWEPPNVRGFNRDGFLRAVRA